MSLVTIRNKLMVALSAYAAAHSPVLTIAKEDVAFTKPTDDTPFLEAILIPANTNNAAVGGNRQRLLGTFQINIWVKEGLGPNVAEAIAAELSTLFPITPKTYLPVSIETPLTAHKAIKDGPYRIVPCDLTYRMEA